MSEQLKAHVVIAAQQDAPRCSCFDEDCLYVVDHARCFRGGEQLINGSRYVIESADGYCPFLVPGMEVSRG